MISATYLQVMVRAYAFSAIGYEAMRMAKTVDPKVTTAVYLCDRIYEGHALVGASLGHFDIVYSSMLFSVRSIVSGIVVLLVLAMISVTRVVVLGVGRHGLRLVPV